MKVYPHRLLFQCSKLFIATLIPVMKFQEFLAMFDFSSVEHVEKTCWTIKRSI